MDKITLKSATDFADFLAENDWFDGVAPKSYPCVIVYLGYPTENDFVFVWEYAFSIIYPQDFQ